MAKANSLLKCRQLSWEITIAAGSSIEIWFGVIPELPSSWSTLSVTNLRVGNGTIAVSAKQNGSQYTTTVSAPTGYKVQLGYTIPAGTKPTSVTLGGTAVKYQTIATLRGNEVVVETPSGPNLSLVINTQ